MARLNEMAVTLDLQMEVASCTEIRNVHKDRNILNPSLTSSVGLSGVARHIYSTEYSGDR